jgi:ABC-type dipeptide/oligopeptide/nickel transport system permease component
LGPSPREFTLLRYLFARVLGIFPVLFGVTLLVYGLIQLTPGDILLSLLGEEAQGISQESLEQLRDQLGLNDPWYVQYTRFLSDLLGGDLRSLKSQRPVVEEIIDRFPYTLLLTTVSLTVAVLLAVPLGVMAAVRRGSIFDALAMTIALLGISVPSFWLAILLMIAFSLYLGWLPASGSGTWQHLVLPTVTIVAGSIGYLARITRGSMLEVLNQDYVRTARAKGLPARAVVYQHAFRNALLPLVTVIGLEFGALLGGAVLTETIFAWPGIGRLAVDAILSRDIYLIQGVVLFVSTLYLLVNLVVDLLYARLNPRVTYA